jgi:hypothetical protein
MNAGHERQDLLPTHGPLSAAPGGSTVGLVEGRRSGDCLLYVCRMVNVLTAMCALLCALAFGMAWWVRGDAPAKVNRAASRALGSGGQAGPCLCSHHLLVRCWAC